MRIFSAWSACILTVILAAAQTSPAGARDFRAADNQSADYPTVEAVVFMGRLVEKRTQGRHTIHVFHSRQLGEEEETIKQTQIGAIDLDRINIAAIASLVPLANVLALPFLFRSTQHLHTVLDGPIGEEILTAFEAQGLIGLTFYDSGARSIYTRGRAVRTIEDLKGLRIRVQPSGVGSLLAVLGAPMTC